MHISSAFDSGNIDVRDASDPHDIRLAIRSDVGGQHKQWFHFRVAGAQGTPLVLHIENAGECSYPKGWEGYRACCSSDRETWNRVDTHYADGVLTIALTPESDLVWLAYFAPYSHERHLDLLAECQLSPLAQVTRLGASLEGRDLDCVDIMQPGAERRTLWVIGRQHPGESMAEWWMEGFLSRLLDPDDPVARALRSRANVHVVPNMNPDGSARGHLRTNAIGANLNREWHVPLMERAPEVKVVRDRMDATGVDLCLDVHGDEALPYNFIAGAHGIVGWTKRLADLHNSFVNAYKRANPDFQDRVGYPISPPGQANTTMCTSAIAQRFDCLAMTLEMPFKDNADAPDPEQGWSPERCRLLGAAALDPMLAVVDALR